MTSSASSYHLVRNMTRGLKKPNPQAAQASVPRAIPYGYQVPGPPSPIPIPSHPIPSPSTASAQWPSGCGHLALSTSHSPKAELPLLHLHSLIPNPRQSSCTADLPFLFVSRARASRSVQPADPRPPVLSSATHPVLPVSFPSSNPPSHPPLFLL